MIMALQLIKEIQELITDSELLTKTFSVMNSIKDKMKLLANITSCGLRGLDHSNQGGKIWGF